MNSENLNISVGLELDKQQFNEKYIQGAIDNSAGNASIRINTVKLGNITKDIQNDLSKQASQLKIQIKDVPVDTAGLEVFSSKAEEVCKKFNERLGNIRITGDLDLKNVEGQMKHDLKVLMEDLSKELGIDGSKISITGIRGAARDFIETFQSEIKSFAISPKVGNIDLGIIDNLDDELISKIKKSFNSSVSEEFRGLGRELGIKFSKDFIKESVATIKSGDLVKFNNSILDEFEKSNGDYDFSQLEKISNLASESGRNIRFLTEQSRVLKGELRDDGVAIKGLLDTIDKIKNSSIKINTSNVASDVKNVSNEIEKLNDTDKKVKIVDFDIENEIKKAKDDMSLLTSELGKISSEMNNMLSKGFNDGSKKALDEYGEIIVKGENLISSLADSGVDFPDEEITKLNEKLGDCFVLLAQVSDAHHEYLKNVQSETSKVEVPVSIASEDIVEEIKDIEQEIEKVAENSNFEMPIDIVASEPAETIISGIEDIVDDVEDSGEFNIELDVFISEESKIRIQKQLEELSEGLSLTVKELKLEESSKLNIEDVELATDMYAKIQSKIDDISNKIKLNINGVNLGEGIVNDIKKSFDELSKNVDSIVNTLSDRLSKNIQLDFNKIKFLGLKDRIAEISQSFNDGIEIKPSVTLSGADVKIDSTSKIAESVISATDDVDIERLSSEHDKALKQITELQRNAELLKEGFKAYQDGMKNAFKKFETENSHLLNYIRGLEKEFDTPVFKKLVKYKKELNNIIEEYNTLGVELTEVEKTRNETYDGSLFTVQYKQYLDTLGLDANKFEAAVERAKEIVARKRQLLKNLEKNLSKATEEEQDVFKELSNAYAKLPKVNTSRTDSLREALVSIFEDDVFKLDFGKLDLRFEADLRSAYDEFFNVLREIQDEYNNKFKNIDGFKEIDIYKNISDSIKSDKLGRLKGEIDNLKGELANVVEIPESKTNTLEDNLGKIADELNVTSKTSQEASESLRLMGNYGFDSGIAGARELNNRLQDIVATANEITSINYTFDIGGGLEKAFVTFKDQLGRMYSERFYWTMPEEEDEEPVFVSKLEKASEKFIDINKEALKMQDTLDNIKGNELVDISRIEKVQALIQKLVESIGDLNTEDARKQVDMLSNEIESISKVDKLMARFDSALDIRKSMNLSIEGLEALRDRIQAIDGDTPSSELRKVERAISRIGSGNSNMIALESIIERATNNLEKFGDVAKGDSALAKLNSVVGTSNELMSQLSSGAIKSVSEVRNLRETVVNTVRDLKNLENKKVQLEVQLKGLVDSKTVNKSLTNDMAKQISKITTDNVNTRFTEISDNIKKLKDRASVIEKIDNAIKGVGKNVSELQKDNTSLFDTGKLQKDLDNISRIKTTLEELKKSLKRDEDVDLINISRTLEQLDTAEVKLENNIDKLKQLNNLSDKKQQLRDDLKGLAGKIDDGEIAKLREEINKMTVDNVVKEFKDLKSIISGFNKSEGQIVRLNRTISSLQDKVTELKGKVGIEWDSENVEGEIRATEDAIKQLIKTRSKLESGKSVNSNTLTESINNANASYGKLDKSMVKILDNKSKIEALQKEIAASMEIRSDLGLDTSELAKMLDNVSKLDATSKDTAKALENMKESVSKFGQSESQIVKIEKTISDTESSVSELMKTLDKSKDSVAKFGGSFKMTEVNDDLKKTRSIIEELESLKTKLEAGGSTSNVNLTSIINKLNTEYGNLKDTINEATKNAAEFVNLSEKLETSLQTRNSLGADASYVEILVKQLKEVDLTSNDAKAALSDLAKTISGLSIADTQIAKVQDTIAKINKEIEKTKQREPILSEKEAERVGMMEAEVTKLNSVLNKLTTGARYSSTEIQRFCNDGSRSMQGLANTAEAVSNETSNVFSGLGSAINQGMQTALGFEFLDIFTDQLMQMKDAIVELDNEMVGLKRVSTASAEEYDRISKAANQTAIEMGKTTQETLNATTAFVKMGYSVSEASDYLSKAGLMLSNVAEMDIDSAVNAIVSTMKGMNYPAEEAAQRASEIVDVINEAGNKFALNSEDLAEGLRIGAASLKIAGNDLYESSALITAGTEVLQDSKQVANGLRTISMRLRGLSEDGEELNPKLEEMIKTMTGVNLTDTNGQFRSTYDILLGISKVWDTLDTKQQALLLENIAGKTQV